MRMYSIRAPAVDVQIRGRQTTRPPPVPCASTARVRPNKGQAGDPPVLEHATRHNFQSEWGLIAVIPSTLCGNGLHAKAP